jgi:multidrug efflux pump subunit AcrA (membrane-fusion protein)
MPRSIICSPLLTALQKSAALSASLEEQQNVLAERTRALQEANTNLQRRAMYLEASTQVSQALATVFELEILLEQAVNLIVQHFDFYRARHFPGRRGWAVGAALRLRVGGAGGG